MSIHHDTNNGGYISMIFSSPMELIQLQSDNHPTGQQLIVKIENFHIC